MDGYIPYIYAIIIVEYRNFILDIMISIDLINFFHKSVP